MGAYKITPLTIASIVDCGNNLLKRGSLKDALVLVYDTVERIVTEPLCVSMVLASKQLDELCINIGRQNLKNFKTNFLSKEKTAAHRSVVYVVSRLQRSGGHSRLVLDFIRSQPEKDHIILATGVVGATDQDFLNNPEVKNSNNIFFKAAPRGNLLSKLTWLQQSLIEINPGNVYLFNHHQDSVAVAAIVPELGLKGSFCHHGDHHLCLGVHLEHLTHIDLHPMGYHYCRSELGINNKYLPLTFEDKGVARVKSSAVGECGLITATVARSNKVEIPYYISYLDLIPKVLKATGGRHIHIGKLTPLGLRRLRSQMSKLGVAADRLVYLEWTPSVWKFLQENYIDLYLAPFPYGAGLTLIEVQGAGVPVVMHSHIYSRVLSGLELAYPEAFHWSDPQKLLSHLSVLKASDLEFERVLARKHYECFHRQELLKEYLRDPNSWKVAAPPLARVFKPHWDEWAVWAGSHLSFSNLLYNFVYRTGRRMRAFINQRLGGQ